jgi:hypothetical protein
MFAFSSRYANLPVKTLTLPDGKIVSYCTRRFLPQPDDQDLLICATVTESDRLDNITQQYLDDPQQFWRVCDGNVCTSPFELTKRIGSKIRITLPQGIPGPSRA